MSIYNNENSTNTSKMFRPDIYDDVSPEYSGKSQETPTYRKGKMPEKTAKKKKSFFKNFLLKFLLIISCLLALIILVGWLMSFFLPAKTTFLIMATDQDGTRTDTIMYGVFDKNEKDISLMSIPRDTYITVDDDVYSKMKEEFPQPGNKSMKINSVHHYGGERYGTKMIIREVEKLTNTDIDFYIKVNFELFRYIIDAVGGIDFYVPRNMDYHDPLQNLHISLKEGQQRLNGEQAEQLLRYRSGYANADLGRVDVQQQFTKAFVTQVFSKGAIASKPIAFIKLVTDNEYVDTNVEIIDIISYLFTINGLNPDSIETQTLPGKSAYAGGQSVYLHNNEECKLIITKMMK